MTTALTVAARFAALPDLPKRAIFLRRSIFRLTTRPRRCCGSEIVRAACSYLCEVGLGYLTLDRSTRTLSGGEVQRVNLTTCLGASLVNTLFVMDEPSVGLHPRDVGRLVRVMHDLRDKGNTLLVVEHEEAIIRAADNLIDIGPGRGERGGELVFSGTLRSQDASVGARSARRQHSLTRDYLSRRQIDSRSEVAPEIHRARSRSPARASTI